jgi:hypothetical protein
MKLFTSNNAELMEVKQLTTQGNNLVVVGTIMGAMPTEAVLTPSELRKALKLLNFKLVLFLLRMLWSK